MSTSKKPGITDAVKTIRDGITALAKDEKDAPQPSPDDDFVQSINQWSAAASTRGGADVCDQMRDTLYALKRSLTPAERKRAYQKVYAFQEDPLLLSPLACSYQGTKKGCLRKCQFHNDSHTFSNPATLFAHYLKPAEDGEKGASPSNKRRKVRNGGRKTRIRRRKGRGSRRAKKTTRRRKYVSLY